jgi:hypothetical protein
MIKQLPVIDLSALRRRSDRQSRPQFHSLSDVIDDYISSHRVSAAAEMDFFRDKSLLIAIEYAALYKLADGHRHPHSYRRQQQALEEAHRRLRAIPEEMQKCSSFESLHTLVEQEIGSIPDIGPLTVYDVTTRIGAHLHLEPEKVYLHSGTREGARALGLGMRRKTLEMSELPVEFRRLTAHEIEDCLCLYKDYLGDFEA